MAVGVLARRALKAAAMPASLITRRRAGDLIILLYHRVGRGGGEIELPLDVFEDHLAYLGER
jgi:hypothetical protein